MNLIDYNKVVEALEKERQYLHNRKQYGAEHILVHHALSVIEGLSVVRVEDPVEPKTIVNNNGFRYDYCGSCNGLLPASQEKEAKYCPWCGRAVKWK